MSELALRDPGPLARFAAVVADPTTMPLVVQRLTDGETLKEIAAAWQIPYGRLAQWIIEDRERTEQYNAALEIWADSLALETVKIADDAVADRDAVAKAKLQTAVRLSLAGKLNRRRFGESTEVKHTGHISLVSILSSMPKGDVIDVTPAPAAVENVPAKNPADGLI